MQNFNYHHPELKNGEVFLCNVDDPGDPGVHDPLECFTIDLIGWKTKRGGDTAYTATGKVISGNRPVFVQRSEIIEAGLNPNKFHDRFVRR
jgi:hypothetical protein